MQIKNTKIILGTLLGTLLVFLMTGCSTKTIDVNKIESERIKLNLQEPKQVKLKDVNFYIITD